MYEYENLISLTRIRQHYSILSKSKKKVADYVLDNYKKVIDFTAEELADATGTSPSTVVWFSRSLGFKGFTDFKLHLERELSTSPVNWLNVESDESMPIIKQKTLRYNTESVEQTMSLLDETSLEMAVKAINNAPLIVLVAEGGSASSARCAYDAFMQIGAICMFLDDPFFQVLSLSNLPKETVVIGISHSGQARNTIESLMVAKEKEMTTIGLVGIVGSPMMKYSDIVLLTGVSDHPFFSDSITARICELNVISTLYASLTIKRNNELGDIRKTVNDLFSIKRITNKTKK